MLDSNLLHICFVVMGIAIGFIGALILIAVLNRKNE